jgi:chorismate-pyruvate lyase
VKFLGIGFSVMLSLSGSAVLGDAVTRAGNRWPDTLLARTQAQALLESLNTGLLDAPTATAFLDQWCADHKFANGAKIRARIDASRVRPVSEEQRLRLQIGSSEHVAYRHVELVCGEVVLSEAENWYVPARLSPEMNRILATTDTPFGRVVQDLKPHRKTFAVEMFWKPAPGGAGDGSGAQDRPDAPLDIPWRLFKHSALVFNADQIPFSEVHESYTSELLLLATP